MHYMKTFQTAYGPAVWCMYCKITPFELSSLSGEELSEQDNYCAKQQEKEITNVPNSL